MKKLFAFLLLGVFMISLSSAFEFDNWVNYEENGLKVRINNNWNLGRELGTAELKSHNSIDEVLKVDSGEKVVTMFYDFDWKEISKNGLGEVEFIDMVSGEYIERDYYFVIWGKIYEERNWDYQCKEIFNKTSNSYSERCENVSVESFIAEKEGWIEMNVKDIPKGKSRIGLAVDVEAKDYVDGIWTIEGKKIKKHASWVAQDKEVWTITSDSNYDIDNDYTVNMTALEYGIIEGIWVVGSGAISTEVNITVYQNSDVLATIQETKPFNQDGTNGGEWFNFTSSDYDNDNRIISPSLDSGDFYIRIIKISAENGLRIKNSDQSFGGDLFTALNQRPPSGHSASGDGVIVYQNFTCVDGAPTVNGECAVTQSVETTLISPEDNQNVLNNTLTLNFTSAPTQTNLTNTTSYIWWNNGTLLNTNFTTLSGNESVNTTFINTLEDGMYKWNAETCGENVNCSFASSNNSFAVHVTPITINITEPTGLLDYIEVGDNQTLSWQLSEPGENLTEHITNCSYTYNFVTTYLSLNTCIVTNTTNFTYVLGGDTLIFNATDKFNLNSNATTSWEYTITEINQTYDENTFETFFNDFRIDIKSSASSITNPKLIYENVTYTTALNVINNTNFYLNSSIVGNESLVGNNSFYWNVTLDGTEYSIPERNQTILGINFSECGGSNNVTYLSIDFLDELSLTSINGTIRNSDFNYYVDDAEAYKTYIFATAGNQSQYDFCFSPGAGTIINDFSISYYGNGYPERTYGSVFELTNETTNLTLNLLDESSGIYATFGFVDATSKVGLSDVNVLIYEGLNLVVEKITDDSGVISEWLNPNILYEVQYTKTGYEGGSQSHRPISTETISIEMASDSFTSDPSITNGLVTYYYPQLTSLDANTSYGFGFYTSEGEESIDLMKFSIYDEDRSLIYEAEQSGDGNMSQQSINTSQNGTLLGKYEIFGEEGGYWIFYRTYYVTVISATDYSLAEWGLSLDAYFPSDDRTVLTNLIWFVLWFITMIGGFTYGYNGSYKTQEDYRSNISVQSRSSTSVGMFFAFIITWIFCYFNLIPVPVPLDPLLIPKEWLSQFFMAVLFLLILIADVGSNLYKHSRRGT